MSTNHDDDMIDVSDFQAESDEHYSALWMDAVLRRDGDQPSSRDPGPRTREDVAEAPHEGAAAPLVDDPGAEVMAHEDEDQEDHTVFQSCGADASEQWISAPDELLERRDELE